MLPSGGYAAYVMAPAAQAIPLPSELGYAEATALLAQGLTAVGLRQQGKPRVGVSAGCDRGRGFAAGAGRRGGRPQPARAWPPHSMPLAAGWGRGFANTQRRGTGIVYDAASGEPTMVAAQQLIGQRQVVRGHMLFAERENFGEYTAELPGYFRAGSLPLSVQTYPIAAIQTA